MFSLNEIKIKLQQQLEQQLELPSVAETIFLTDLVLLDTIIKTFELELHSPTKVIKDLVAFSNQEIAKTDYDFLNYDEEMRWAEDIRNALSKKLGEMTCDPKV